MSLCEGGVHNRVKLQRQKSTKWEFKEWPDRPVCREKKKYRKEKSKHVRNSVCRTLSLTLKSSKTIFFCRKKRRKLL